MLRSLSVRLSFSLITTMLVGGRVDAATVTGRLVDPASRPVPGAQVLILCGQSVAATASTDAEGRFDIPDLQGRCELRVAVSGFAAKPIALDLPADSTTHDAGTVRLEISAVSESVVVSAAQVDVPLSRASAAVTVMTAEELRARQLTTVADALREVPGLTVLRSGSAGAITSVFPRGGESDYSLVLINGVPANAFGGGFDFSHLSVNDIDRIEVVRGPQSALFGSNAIGSVIRIVTREGGPIRGDATAEGGSFGSSRFASSAAGSSGGWFWGGGVERVGSNGSNGRLASTGERVTNDDYMRLDAGGSGGWRAASGLTVRGDVRFEHDDRGDPGAFGSNPIGAFEAVDTISRGKDDRWIGSIGGTIPSGTRVRTQVLTTWNTIDSDFVSPFGPSTSGSKRWTLGGQSDVHVNDGFDVSAGAEYLREQATSTFITDDTGEIPVKRRVAGVFGEARWSSHDRVFVTGGVRVDDITREAMPGVSNPFSPRPPFAADTVVSTNPKIAAAWIARPDTGTSTKLRAAAGTGIRPPDAFEIAFTDNPSLAPERSRSVEGGVDQAFLSGRAMVQATVFANHFDDLIVAVGRFTGSSQFRTDNISNARARGLELGSAFHGSAGAFDVQGRITYTFLSSEILAVDRGTEAPAPFTPGDPLLRRPRHQWSLDVTASRGPAVLWLRGGGRGRVLDVEPTLGTFGGLYDAAGYAVWNAGGSWTIGHGVDVFARVENLFNRAYEEVFGFPALPRGAMAGIRVAASR